MAALLDAGDPGALLAAVLAARSRGTTPVVLGAGWAHGVARTVERLVADAPPVADPSLVVLTSGTAGRPRAVRRTWTSWEASHTPLSELTGIGPGSTVLVPGPLPATLNLYAAVHAVDVGARLVLGGLHESGWDVVHLVPAVLRALLDRPDDLTGRLAVCAGDALPAALRARAAERGLRVVEYYGASELSFVAVDPDGSGLRPFPGALVESREGELWVRSPYLCTDVLGDRPLRRDADGAATVGDVGRLLPDGTLEVLGRGASAVTTGGTTVLAEDVEAALRLSPGVRDVAVVGLPDEALGQVVAAVLEPSSGGGRAPTRSSMRALAAATLPPAARPRRWYAVPSLPRSEAGKVARAAVAKGLADGSLDAAPLA